MASGTACDTAALTRSGEQRTAFALQYTSLMLIVLTFIVGAFASRQLASPGPVKPLEDSVPHEVPRSFGDLSYTTLFQGESHEVNPEAVFGISHILLNHDVLARISVYESASQDASHSAALIRAMYLSQALEERGVPFDAFVILVKQGEGPEQALVSFDMMETAKND